MKSLSIDKVAELLQKGTWTCLRNILYAEGNKIWR
jgi:hypothetical protein